MNTNETLLMIGTNKAIIAAILLSYTTNWVDVHLTSNEHKEVGIVCLDEHAQVVYEGKTNLFLLSSKVVRQELVRKATPPDDGIQFWTNYPIYFRSVPNITNAWPSNLERSIVFP